MTPVKFDAIPIFECARIFLSWKEDADCFGYLSLGCADSPPHCLLLNSDGFVITKTPPERFLFPFSSFPPSSFPFFRSLLFPPLRSLAFPYHPFSSLFISLPLLFLSLSLIPSSLLPLPLPAYRGMGSGRPKIFELKILQLYSEHTTAACCCLCRFPAGQCVSPVARWTDSTTPHRPIASSN